MSKSSSRVSKIMKDKKRLVAERKCQISSEIQRHSYSNILHRQVGVLTVVVKVKELAILIEMSRLRWSENPGRGFVKKEIHCTSPPKTIFQFDS